MTRIQAQILINQFNNLNINQKFQMTAATAVNYVLIPFEGNINPGNQQGIKIYFQAKKEIDREDEKLYISV